MKTIKKTLLHFHQGTSNKVYKVYLIEVTAHNYLVNFTYGRYGAILREGTKTTTPVNLEKAQKLYDSLVVSKINKDYKITSGYNPLSKEEKKERGTLWVEDYNKLLISRLKGASEERLREVDNHTVSRLIYRAGALKLEEAKASIVTLYATSSQEKNAFYYAVAWALGRFKDPSLRRTIESIHEKLDETSRYIVEEALFLLNEAPEREEIEALNFPMPFKVSLSNENLESFVTQVKLLEEMVDSTYERYQNIDSWYQEDRKAIKAELDSLLQQMDELFLKLYLYATIDTQSHKAMVKAIPFLSINEFNFSLFRRLYKMAEIRDDYAVMAELVSKIESKKMACYEIYEWEKENRRSLGCSRLYFKKRTLRYIQDLGRYNAEGYITFAKYLLLSMNNYEQEFEAFSTSYYDRDWNFKTKDYEKFAVHLTLMYVLYGAGKRYMLAPSKKMWEIANKSIKNEQRPEMHKELWDRYPQTALEVLSQSRVEEIQAFAFAIIEAHPEVIKNADLTQLLPLLNAASTKVRNFFFTLLKERYEHTQEEVIVYHALLSSDKHIAQFALEMMEQQRALLEQPNLVADAIFVVSDTTFKHLLVLLKELETPQAVVENVFSRVMQTSLPVEETLRLRMVTLLKTMYKGLSLSHLEQLMKEMRLSDHHYIAAELIRSDELNGLEIPLALKEKIASYSEDSIMLATTIYLLGKLDDDKLMQEHTLLISFLYHKEKQVSLEVMKIVQRLGLKNKENAEVLLREIIEHAFSSTADTTADNVVEVVVALKIVYSAIGIDQTYRLLIAKSKLAQRLGALLLEKQNAENFSVVQWATLAKNPNKSIRLWAYHAYENYPKKVKEAMPKSLMIFDTQWEDTRVFACGYFESFKPLSTDDIVVIADSNYSDVQQFAKQLIEQRVFDKERLLLKLSQHPALSIQKFVTDFMLSGMAVEQLLKLERFFNTLLHSVNQNRAAKTRVIGLLNYHLGHRDVAQMYARLATHHSASMVWADKTAYIEAMMQIKEYHPDIVLPLEIVEPKEVSYGV